MPTMKAAQYDKKNHKVSINDVPIPTPAEGQFLVKVRAASLCHSDLMWAFRADAPCPMTMGHEGVGLIAAMHASCADKGFRVGDRIGMLYYEGACYACDGCAIYAPLCERASGDGGRSRIKGISAHGNFAEYTLCDWENAIVLPDSLPMERISPLFCAGLTAFHSVDKCELKPGDWIAIVGCGGLGQMAVRYAKAMELKVVGLDVNDDMLDIVKQHGADGVVNTKTNPDYAAAVRKLSGKGCHAAAVFSDALPAYASAQRVLRSNGLLMVVGLPNKPLEIPAFLLVSQAFRVKGANTGNPSEMKKGVDFTAKHQIIPDVVFRKLEEMPRMCEELEQGKAPKRMVVLFEDRAGGKAAPAKM